MNKSKLACAHRVNVRITTIKQKEQLLRILQQLLFFSWIGIGSKLVRAFLGQCDFGDALTVVRTGVVPPAPGAAVAAPAESGNICADTLISGDDSPLVAQEPVANLVAGGGFFTVRVRFVFRHIFTLFFFQIYQNAANPSS